MITFLSFASEKRENELIRGQLGLQAARWTDEAWNYNMFEAMGPLEAYLAGEPLVDLVCWDVTPPGSVEHLMKLRKAYRQAFLMVVADCHVSPMAYLKPGILPSALILKPLEKGKVSQVIGELLEVFSQQFDKKELPETFVIESREGKQYIPLQQICYVEAREKKLYIRTRQEEFGFYETIENMEKQLPEFFCRCHRSYIVNMQKVKVVKPSLNVIELQDGITVPLSRSYKKTIKEYHKNG
ncbi:MAG: LytTR family DNA-binding domain-containing protein [Lachnospiraceae bacterium]|nr:LytTR family DNA-binding domain-containing protein [Lachnospiraceae bacterium]